MIRNGELDQKRSFSFSSFDFNSCHGLFSSDDDDDEECGRDKYLHSSNQGYASYLIYDTDDDDGAYIEINLNPPSTQTTTLDDIGNRNFDKEKEQLAELRISFSAGISPTVTTCLSSTTQHVQGTIKKPRLGLFVSLTRIVNAFMISTAKNSNSLRVLEGNNVAHEFENGGADHLQPISKADCNDMLRSRKDRTMVASKHNGIINFLVKFKYRNIPSMLVSMMTPKARGEPMRARQPLLQRGSSTCSRNQMNDNVKSKTRDYSELDYQNLNCNKSNSSVAGIVNLKAIRGVLDALRYYTSARIGTSSANKQSKSKSCPGSIKSSPMHRTNGCDNEVRKFYSRDNSVQAAIAHCKKSLGAQAEFEFLNVV